MHVFSSIFIKQCYALDLDYFTFVSYTNETVIFVTSFDEFNLLVKK
jgi:hypothetical protein